MTEPLEDDDRSAHATVPARYAVEMLDHARVDRDAVLAEARVPPAALEGEGSRLTGPQTAALHRAVVRAADDEVYGWFRRPVPRGTYVGLLRMLTGCRDVRAALNAAVDLYRVFDGHAHWSIEVAAGVATLRACPRTDAHRDSVLYAHAMLLTPWRTVSWLAAETIPLLGLGLERRFDALLPESRYLFGVDPEPADGPCLRLDASVLDWPMRRTRDEAEPWAREGSFGAIIGRPARGSLEARVRSLLARSTPIATGQLADIAKQLGLSRQTLARRLRERGLTFQQVKDALRRDHAITRLTQGATVAVVARALGFSEASAFNRAFRRWTGTPPGRYREAPPRARS